MVWDALNQKSQRSNHADGNCAIHGERQNPCDVEMPFMVRYDQRNSEHQDNCQEQPTRTYGERLRQCPIDTSRRQHRHHRGPSRFAHNLSAHKFMGKTDRSLNLWAKSWIIFAAPFRSQVRIQRSEFQSSFLNGKSQRLQRIHTAGIREAVTFWRRNTIRAVPGRIIARLVRKLPGLAESNDHLARLSVILSV